MARALFPALTWTVTLCGLMFVPLLGLTARAGEPRLSISGYDPVAYFTDGRPIPGKEEYESLWHHSRWRFASSEHRDLFSKNPQHYAPQYDGYCAMGAAEDLAVAHKDTVDPEAWAIVDGKLYLLHNLFWLAKWREHAKDYISRADMDWRVVEDLPAPVIVGPPCVASPPTTSVSLRDGGHMIIVGGQVARDEAGNVVGKGDMRAQIEQVGRNVDACLGAGGATANDIVFTVNHVTEPAEFGRYADLLPQYFGPPSPKSMTVPAGHLPSPDFLLQVEAFAVIK